MAPKEKAKAKEPAGPPVVLAPRVNGTPVVVAPPPILPEALIGAPAFIRAPEVGVCGGGGGAGGAAAHAAFAAFQGAGCGGLGDAGLPPEAECHVLLLAVLDHGDGKGAPGYDGGHGGGNVKASGMAPAAPPSWGPPGFGAAPIMPPGVWPAPGVGFGHSGAAPGGIGDCFAHAVHASAGGGG